MKFDEEIKRVIYYITKIIIADTTYISHVIYVRKLYVSHIDIITAKKSQILMTTESGFGGG
jgi:hypothetical protein